MGTGSPMGNAPEAGCFVCVHKAAADDLSALRDDRAFSVAIFRIRDKPLVTGNPFALWRLNTNDRCAAGFTCGHSGLLSCFVVLSRSGLCPAVASRFREMLLLSVTECFRSVATPCISVAKLFCALPQLLNSMLLRRRSSQCLALPPLRITLIRLNNAMQFHSKTVLGFSFPLLSISYHCLCGAPPCVANPLLGEASRSFAIPSQIVSVPFLCPASRFRA